MSRPRHERGQSAVELALVLPLVIVVSLGVIAVGSVVRDRVALTHATREAARAAVVDPSPGAVRAAADRSGGLDPSRLTVSVSTTGAGDRRTATVSLRYRPPDSVPLIGWLVSRVQLDEHLTVGVEVPPGPG